MISERGKYIMELAVHMKNIKTNEERIKKVNGVDSSNHEPVKDFYYGSERTWTMADIKHIVREYYKKK